MRVVFKSVKMTNFKSFNSAYVNLDRYGFIAVQGINHNKEDNSKSNGVGKSSIFDAILWALTGKTVQGSNNVESIYNNDATLVELVFEYNGDEFKVYRGKRPSKLQVFKNKENISGKGIRDTEKILGEHVTNFVTYNLLSSVVVMGQGLPQKFSGNTPAGRKATLEMLSNTDFMIEDLKSRVTKRLTDVNAEIRTWEDDKLSTETKKNVLISQNQEIEVELTRLKNFDTSNFEAEMRNLDRMVEDAKANVYGIKINRDKATTDRELLQVKFDEINVDRYEKLTNFIPPVDIESTQKDLSACEALLRSTNSELRSLMNIKDVCPTCGQKLEGIEIPTDKIVSLQVEIDKMASDRLDMLDKIKKAEEENKAARDSINTYRLDEYNETQNELNNLDRAIKELTRSLDDANVTLVSCEADRATHRKIFDECHNNIKRLEQQIMENNEKIKSCDTHVIVCDNSLSALNNRRNIINKFNGLLKRDFRSYLLQNVVDYLDKKMKEYARDVFGWEAVSLVISGNEIALILDGKDYEVLSGGEKQKVDVLTQLAIRDLLCSYSNFSCNLFVLDEIFDGLDTTGCDAVLNLISTKLSDVSATYIITHHQDLSIPYDDEIRIVKGEDKVSRVL